MALDHTWNRIQQLSERLRVAIKDDPDRVSDIWAERQALLEDILNESSLAALSAGDLAWLTEAVEQLQQNDQALMSELSASQQAVMQALKKQQGDAKAISAYQKQQSQR